MHRGNSCDLQALRCRTWEQKYAPPESEVSQNILESFRREQQEGLMVRKGARSLGEREGEWASFPVVEPGKHVL